jgi:UDP-N-acetylmuramoyl-tripeptide--D-alanyl-D-alanine ligase
MTTFFLLFGLTLCAALSPLLTFAWFFQVKEWRWDRLKEQFKREGWVTTVFGGRIRPFLVLACIAAIPLKILRPPEALLTALGLLSVLTLLQFLLRRQRVPVRTSKALAIAGLGLLIDGVVFLALFFLPPPLPLLLPVLVLVQSLVILLSWALLLPLDRRLKRRTLDAGRTRRAAHPELLVIGITGSVGKTTTKELLAHILRDRHPLASPAHVNTEMGVARWLQQVLPAGRSLPPGTPLIVEMGAYRSGEISTLCRIVQPSIGIVTFIGSQHLALFGSQEALLQAKGELLRSLPPNGRAFLNGDCDLCRTMCPLSAAPVTIVGTGGKNDLEATDIEETPTGIGFRVGETQFYVPLHGTHNVSNILLAIAAAERLGLPRRTIAERIRTFVPPHHAFDVRSERDVTILDATHNASAASFKAAIAWAGTQPFERKILLTSGLIELGEEHERTHRELGSLAADVFDDVLFLTSASAQIFGEGYGQSITIVKKKTPPVARGTLLVCVGRMPQIAIRRLLPQP